MLAAAASATAGGGYETSNTSAEVRLGITKPPKFGLLQLATSSVEVVVSGPGGSQMWPLTVEASGTVTHVAITVTIRKDFCGVIFAVAGMC